MEPDATSPFGGAPATPRGERNGDSAPHGQGPRSATYAALDLGTNNCRLLVARPTADGFRIVDAFSRIVRLGEGVSRSGRLGEAAIDRTLAALAVCRDKMRARGVARARLIATEACRAAENGPDFIARVREQIGLDLEIVDRRTEAHLAAEGCASLADQEARSIVLFDIGGGSSEIVWLARPRHREQTMSDRIRIWVSLPIGVVSLAERFGGRDVPAECFEAMVRHIMEMLENFVDRSGVQQRCERFHLLGTSGTVTTIAGVHLNLARYDRRRVDGLWMDDADVTAAMHRLRAMSFDERANNGCIGPDRADLVLAGCAILEAIRRSFPSKRIRIADRGLREGILMQLMSADRAWRGAARPPRSPA